PAGASATSHRVQDRSIVSRFMRAVAPAAMRTSALRHRNCSATNAMSSSLAFPSTGGDLRRATHVPSGDWVSDVVLDLGFTFTRSVSDAMRPSGNGSDESRIAHPMFGRAVGSGRGPTRANG